MREGRKHGFARHLRWRATDAERRLWFFLRDRRMAGHKFRRQWPIGPYIVDFACVEQALVVEVDGGQHCDSLSDDRRDAFLRTEGYRVLRFWNTDVLQNMEGVLHVILDRLSLVGPHPDLPPQAGEGAEHLRNPEPHPDPPPAGGEGAEHLRNPGRHPDLPPQAGEALKPSP